VTGLPAWERGQTGQVGNEAALTVATSAGVRLVTIFPQARRNDRGKGSGVARSLESVRIAEVASIDVARPRHTPFATPISGVVRNASREATSEKRRRPSPCTLRVAHHNGSFQMNRIGRISLGMVAVLALSGAVTAKDSPPVAVAMAKPDVAMTKPDVAVAAPVSAPPSETKPAKVATKRNAVATNETEPARDPYAVPLFQQARPLKPFK